jgi:hypothetical protein
LEKFVDTQHFVFFIENVVLEYVQQEEERKRRIIRELDNKMNKLKIQKMHAEKMLEKYQLEVIIPFI